MRKQILLRTLLITLLAVLIVFGACIMVMYDKGSDEIAEKLVGRAELIAMLTDSAEDLKLLESSVSADEEMRITIIASSGDVIYDSYQGVIPENHLSRPEIKYAAGGNSQVVERYSESMDCRMYYYAVTTELSNGELIYIRLSGKSSGELIYIMTTLPFLLLGIVAAVVVAVVFAERFSSGMVAKIVEVGASLRSLNRGEYKPIDIETDSDQPELYGVLSEINELNKSTFEHMQSERELIIQKSDFFANASHELKTPITVMMGFSELLLSKEELDPASRKQAERIHAESERLANLVNDMLNLSRLERSSVGSQVKLTVDLREIASEVLGELAKPIAEKNITVKLSGEGSIQADPKRIFELVGNLCSNAVNYNKENGTLDIKIIQSRDKLTLLVSDTGIGIPKEHIPRLCERFYRIDSSRSKKTGGTGLGLAIVKHICALYDAKLTIESEVDKGTSVSVVFAI